MLEDMSAAQYLRVAGTSNDRQWVYAKVLMFSTDFKEQWDTAQTYGYGCVSCNAPRKPQHTGELHVPAASRDMHHTKRIVLKAQQSGEYGANAEWKDHLQGASKPFVKPDAQSARLEVRHYEYEGSCVQRRGGYV